MVYKFRSRASGDVIMLQAVGDAVMGILGREPSARGIIEPQAMPQAIAALRAAARAAPPPATDRGPRHDVDRDDDDPADADPVTLGARVHPLIDLLERSAAAGEPVTWGV